VAWRKNWLWKKCAKPLNIHLDVSERFACEVDAQSRKREILMAYPAATVRIEKTDELGGAK